MKKIVILFLLSISLVYAKVHVVVSIAPQKAYVEEIGGDLVDVTLLVPIGANPNFYEPKASQMRAVERADVYFTIGGHFEKAWLPRIKEQNGDMEIIDCSKSIERIDMQFNKKLKRFSSKQRPTKDIHVWTTPKNIEKIGHTIYETLVRFDRKNREIYQKNYDLFAQKAEEIDKEIKTILSDVQEGAKFMVFHPAWGYFANAYKLEQIAIEVEGKEPKLSELEMMIEKAKKLKIKGILTQPEFSQKGARLIAQELGIKVIGISPLNPHWSKNLISLANAIANKK
ncbi:MAG: zinc ABC transporter substrate-binding protein [Epsilonproteobacteria bacterium]|nr:zinc ABC transporter substrate-binding protein [Campylobacterota bacterium]